MADAEATSENPEEKPKGKGGMIIVVVLVAVSAGLGFAVPKMMSPAAAVEKADPNAMELPDPIGKIGFVKFGETVANLNDGRMTRYLRIGITLQVDEAQMMAIEELQKKKDAVLRNWVLSHVSDKTMDDIRGAAGQNRLRREILEQFNAVIFSDGVDRIQDVLFEEFNVQ